MKKIGKERTAGFSLLEVVVAIAIIGLISAPICSSLILAGRINAHSQAVMEAHLNVRTAVETLMKDGVTQANDNYRAEAFPNVTVKTVKDGENPYYHVTVSDKHTEPLVTVETYVRAVPKGGGT
jgi:prepilin-type cleavage/methylation N-terminal domain protein